MKQAKNKPQTENHKTLRAMMNLWVPQDITKSSFEFSPFLHKSPTIPVLRRQKTTMVSNITASPLKHATTLRSCFFNEMNEISQFLHFNSKEKFSQDYPINKVLFINNFQKRINEGNNLVTNKFIFHIRKKKRRFVPSERLNEELKDLYLRETNRPNIENVRSNYCLKVEGDDKTKKHQNMLNKKMRQNQNDILMNLKFNGKKIFKSIDYEAENQNQKMIDKNQEVELEHANRNFGKRPVSASTFFDSAERKYKFVQNLLNDRKKYKERKIEKSQS